MNNLYDILKNKYIKNKKKINGKTYEFYAFVGYKPIIKELMDTECHNGEDGCFQFMFVEKDKAKVVCLIRNKEEIETVCFLINDSWIIGDQISSDPENFGNIGFYTRPKYRGNGNSHKICKFFEENMNKIIDDLSNYKVHIQKHVVNALEKNFKEIEVDMLTYGENSGDFMISMIEPKHPYSIDFKMETEKLRKEFTPYRW